MLSVYAVIMRFAAALLGSLVIVSACGTTATAAPPTIPAVPSAAPSVPTVAPSIPAATGSPAATAVAGAGSVPASCQDLLTAVAPYTGNISATQSLGKPQHLSCEFQYGDGKGILIVNIGVGGTQAAFDALKASTATGGRTVAAVTNLGVAAFSVSEKGVPGGVTSLGADGILYVVESNLQFNQDITLIQDLMHVP